MTSMFSFSVLKIPIDSIRVFQCFEDKNTLFSFTIVELLDQFHLSYVTCIINNIKKVDEIDAGKGKVHFRLLWL